MPSEHAEQVTFVREFERIYPSIRIFAIPNGGYRHAATAKKLKMEGVKKGVPDLFIPEWALWIEMKRTNGGTLSADQRDWIEYLESIGHSVIVGRGYLDALEQIEVFLYNKTILNK